MERYRGHFLNWYDTSDLSALDPRYVSTVDSGNLAGDLLVVKNACEKLRMTPPRVESRLDGLNDAIGLLRGGDGQFAPELQSPCGTNCAICSAV